jgi:hypothetical protein
MRGKYDLEMIDDFCKKSNQTYKYEQIEKIVKNCEDFCEYDNHESTYSCQCKIIKAYKEIAEIVMGVSECQLSSYMMW